LAVPIALTLIVKKNCSAISALLAVVDDFNMWWVVAYGRVTGDWKADMDTGSGSLVIGVIRRFWQFQLH
jgi:hypothetical protein